MTRRHVDVLDLVRRDDLKVGPVAGNEGGSGDNLSVLHAGIGRGDVGVGFFIGPQPNDFVGQLALVHLAIGRDQKAVLIDAGIDRQAGDETDVGAFRRLDRADATVVRNVYVADFEAGSFAIETARAKGRQSPLVR